MSDHDAFYDVFYDEDLRFDSMLAFKRLRCEWLNLLFPARQALVHGRLKAFAEINVLAGKHCLSRPASMNPYGLPGVPGSLLAIVPGRSKSRGSDRISASEHRRAVGTNG